jgi:hypothetical protein
MTRKVADLRHAMQANAKSAGRQVRTSDETNPSTERPATYPENPHYRPGRAKMANVTGYFPPAVKKQLRIMAAEGDTTIQRLLAEALNDLFAKYGKPEIAPVEAK